MAVVLNDLTTGAVAGAGVFDSLMRSMKAHLIEEFSAGRIHGKEYSTVYLGAMSSVLDKSLEFLLQRDRLEKELLLMDKQILKATQEVLLVEAEVAKAEAQTELAVQQKANLLLEADLIPEQVLKLIAETALITQNGLNAIIEGTVLTAQKCKLDAEFDLLNETKLKAIAETSVLNQKKVTEQAQTNSTGIDAGSVIGKQLALYQAQTDGFTKDAILKAASKLMDSWAIRRTTDEATIADGVNMLNDVAIGRGVTKMLDSVGA